MTVLVFEDNLMWSSRLVKSLRALGHEPIVHTRPDGFADAELAIINLGSEQMSAERLVPILRERGIRTIGHAGHKESELLSLGRDAGCDVVATNSQITFKLNDLINALISA